MIADPDDLVTVGDIDMLLLELNTVWSESPEVVDRFSVIPLWRDGGPLLLGWLSSADPVTAARCEPGDDFPYELS